MIAAGLRESSDEQATGRLIAYAALAVTVIVSIDATGGLPAFIGARTYLLYPILLLGPAWRMDAGRRLGLARGMVLILAVVAGVGLIEVATHGRFLSTLGYRTDFAETSTTSASPYFEGFRRATGGLGNFLEFGLLMNVGLLLARASLRGPARIAAMALFTVGALLSWSRLSWALAVIIAAIPLGVMGSTSARFQMRRLAGALTVCIVVALALNLGPGQVLLDRISGTDRVTQRSNSTRASQLSLALSQVGTRLVGSGPGTQGAAADRQAGGPSRTVTDNGYLIWLLELGWLGFAAILTLSLLIVAGIVGAGAWWALTLLGVLAVSNALFAASDSRVVLVISFIAMRVLWPSREEREPDPAAPGAAAEDRPVPVRRPAPTPSGRGPHALHPRPVAALDPPLGSASWPSPVPASSAMPERVSRVERKVAQASSETRFGARGSVAPTRGAPARPGRRRRVARVGLFLLMRIAGRARRRKR